MPREPFKQHDCEWFRDLQPATRCGLYCGCPANRRRIKSHGVVFAVVADRVVGCQRGHYWTRHQPVLHGDKPHPRARSAACVGPGRGWSGDRSGCLAASSREASDLRSQGNGIRAVFAARLYSREPATRRLSLVPGVTTWIGWPRNTLSKNSGSRYRRPRLAWLRMVCLQAGNAQRGRGEKVDRCRLETLGSGQRRVAGKGGIDSR